MTDPVLWPLGRHTPGKHLVLKGYLDAWLPILGMTQGRILFIDGFCGPGEYEGGEPGSPIVALRALKEHAARTRITAEVRFIFIDTDSRRIAHLRGRVEEDWPERPANVHVDYEPGQFDATLGKVLDAVDAAGRQLAPTFLMADPFGISDTPMEVFRRVLRNDKSEVYISFMWEHFNRFKETNEFPPHLDAMFGSPDWRAGIEIADTGARRDFIFGLYKRQLRAAGAKFVLHFELYEGERLKYAIFFATKHPKACDRMKQAIWKVDPFGGYAFRGAQGEQLRLDLGEPDLNRLGRELQERFGGMEWVTVESVEGFCQSDQTDFHTGHYKKALARLEDAGALEVDATSRKRRRTYPGGTRMRFRPAGDRS